MKKLRVIKWMIYSTAFYYLFLFNNIVYSQMINTTFERISKKDGLSQSTGVYIIQDKNGFIWVATYGGLNKYDGNTFKVYHHDDNDSIMT